MNIQTKYLNIFDFYPDGVVVGGSKSFHNVDNENDNMVIQVANADSINFVVEGCVNPYDDRASIKKDDEIDWSTLAVINLKDYKILDTITENGIYAVSMSGVRKLRVVVSDVSGEGVYINGGFGE